jgi:putative membrane protein
MRNFAIRLIINGAALAITATLLPGITIRDDSLMTLFIVALIFGIINALVKPILTLLTCPLIIVSLGLFIFVLNGALLMITSALSGGRLVVETLGWAILGGIIMGIASIIVEAILRAFGLEEDRHRRRAES